MTLRKLIANTTAASNPSWTIRWTIFTAGWWKYWRREMPQRWANILTRRPFATSQAILAVRVSPAPSRKSSQNKNYRWMAMIIAVLLPFGFAAGNASAQATSKKKSRAKSAPCRAGCQPNITAQDLIAASLGDMATQKELSELARNLRNAGPGAYERLSAFAAKHTADVWGARAALALGYDDYQKNKAQQGLNWLAKAKNEAVL